MDATKKKQPGEKKTQTATEQAMETGAPALSALEKRKKKLIRGYLRLGLRGLVIAAVLFLLFTEVFLVCRMRGTEMFPAIQDGDLLVAFRLEKDYRKNDVAVYSAEGEQRVGRIVARAGDWLEIDGDGSLRVNGTVQRGEIFYPTEGRVGTDYPIRIPEDSVYILGDFRPESRDSRDFGPVAVSDLEGKLISLFRRRGL